MNTNRLGKTNLEVSRISLGTVEIGMAYGLGNNGLPSEQEATTILKSAVEMGITYFDTARGYGIAEERIGKSGIGKDPNIVIGTKFGQFLKQERDLRGTELEKRIREDINTSRKNLHQDTLQLAQFHNELEDYTDFTEICEIIKKLQEEQKVLHVGVAVRGEAAALSALNTDCFQTIQLSYNIVDQRMVPLVFPKAHEKNVGIINRSVLLKGALTPAREQLPESLHELKEHADHAARIAETIGVDLPTLAIRFALSSSAISTVLIGTTSPKHIKSALNAANEGALPKDVLEELSTLGITDPEQIDPAKWPKVD